MATLEENVRKRIDIQRVCQQIKERVDVTLNNLHYTHLATILKIEEHKAVARIKSELAQVEPVKLKTTVILTSVSLLGQW